ncbi:MAG: hypothetical protein AAFY49_10575, partial [Pseudomonadota bacterium]
MQRHPVRTARDGQDIVERSGQDSPGRTRATGTITVGGLRGDVKAGSVTFVDATTSLVPGFGTRTEKPRLPGQTGSILIRRRENA